MTGTPEARHQDPGDHPPREGGDRPVPVQYPGEQALPAVACTDLAVAYCRGDWGRASF